MDKKYLSIAPEVAAALAENRPVVALESTILSHGMPYPENVEFSHKVEDIIRAEGA
ncbi:MAG: pseudouridine-5'-phosphate glycosidase, partial [Angelakisella sp.]